jgi:rhomboid protease GluP
MYFNEPYAVYKLAYQLVTDNQYEVLYIDSDHHEIWLEKYDNKVSKVIRLASKGFAWKNHLKRDIAIVFQKAKSMKTLLIGKQVELYNVYVSSDTPIDDWEMFKKPIQLNEKNPIKMHVFYLCEGDFATEKTRFEQEINVPAMAVPQEEAEEVQKEKIIEYQTYLKDTLQTKQTETKEVLTFGKPFFTYILLVINVFIFLLLEWNGGSTETETLIQYGAKYNPDILDGQWWRLVSSMFLHIGFIHLFMNMLAVFYLGVTVERIFGSWRFIIIYFMAGIGGSLTSFAFTTNVSAGASGALFGLFGALLFFGLKYKRIFFQTMGSGILLLIGINIVFGFTVQQIDMGAHLGGLVAGFFAASIVHLPKKKNYLLQFIALIVYVVLIIGTGIFGVHNNLNSVTYQLTKIEELNNQAEFEEAVEVATTALKNPGELEAYILFQRSFAYIQLNDIDSAINDLEKAITLDDTIAEAHYNLALLYHNTGQESKAKESVEEAYKLNPKDKEYKTLYEEITDKTPK